MKYIAVGLLLVILVGTWITEYVLNNESDNYRCYLKMEEKGKATESTCPGYWTSCKTCAYKKNYDKEVKYCDREQSD